MKVIKLNCPTCGAPISVPEAMEFINCASCGSFLAIDRGEGYVALKVAEKLARAIEDSGKDTQDVIRESITVTRSELQRLQAVQEISAIQMRLNNIQSEIRTIQRQPQSLTTENQLKGLHTEEFLAMDQIRVLNQTAKAPAENDVQGQILFFENEIRLIEAEISAIKQSGDSQRNRIEDILETQREKLEDQVRNIKIQQIKNTLKTYRRPHDKFDNQDEAEEFLLIIEKDLQKIESRKDTAEGRVVHSELKARLESVKNKIFSMEHARLSGMMSTTNFQVDPGNLLSLYEYNTHIDYDLSLLPGGTANTAVSDIRNKLLEAKQQVERKIRKLEKQQAKLPEKDLRSGSNTGKGVFAFLLAGFISIFAGIPLLIKSLIPNKVSLPKTVVIDDVGQEERNEKTIPQESTNVKKKPNTKSVGTGCLLGLLTMIIAAIFFFTILSILLPKGSENSMISTGMFLLSIAIGLIAGTIIFLRRAAPNTTIVNVHIKKQRDFKIDALTDGLENPAIIKATVAIVTCLLVWLLTISVSMIFGQPSSNSSTLLVILAFILGPLLAALMAYHTNLLKQ